ncbi:MAG: tRNA (N6-isopentenyl adenosine(37)-C2)-methylthiotransferase MiaB [Thermodesulfovibrionales bacterium]|nr:tRNA (N6-isopentenyl adenosine(37)-C2)-methylthiotransferase MiaB [Thermodesulfovibrionales bacterium]
MKKYHITTFGCQMNFHDSEKMAGILDAEGYQETANPIDADIIIFNTCSIRQKAEQKFFSQLGKIKSLKKKRPSIKIAVAGCIAQHYGSKIFEKAPYVDFVLGTQNLHLLKDFLNKDFYGLAIDENPSLTDTDLPIKRYSPIIAYVNIMYGCNNFCSYCVVPYTRGPEKSRTHTSIINEVKELASRGIKEVILLGQNVNSYRSELNFPQLLVKINEVKGIERIRFITSHPKDLSDELILAIKDLDKVCEHIHLPLQSGSSKILRLMNREYTYYDYLSKIQKLRKEVPDIAITSDIIAGFPQETEEDHLQTIRALKEIEFDGIFSFKFSKREGTVASQMSGQVDEEVKSRRLYEIIEIQNEITERKNKKLEGTYQEILLEGLPKKEIEKFMGRTRTNKICIIPKKDDLKEGDVVKILITKANRHSLLGSIV